MGTLQEHLIGTVEYTEKLLSLGERVVFDVISESVAAFQEHEFLDKDGVALDAESGENWIRVRRLHETKAPAPEAEFEEWYDGDLKSPDKPPTLRPTKMVKLDRETVEKWVAAGFVKSEDVLKPMKAEAAGEKDVILRSAHLPNFEKKWNTYIAGPWSEWAAIEKPRRKVIALYNKLYQIHQRMVSFGDDNPLELVMGVGVARWEVEGHKLTCTLIEQGVETELEADGSFIVRPRAVLPVVNLKPFHALEKLPGSEAVQRDATSELSRLLEDTAVAFSPFDPNTFTSVLRICASRLSATGRYFSDENAKSRFLPPVGEHLVVTDTWILLARQRTEDIRRDDLKRLQKKIAETRADKDLPAAAGAFVRRPSDTPIQSGIDMESSDLTIPESPSVIRPGASSGRTSSPDPSDATHWSRDDLFFPLPFNDEQIEIAAALRDGDPKVVVVQAIESSSH